MHPIFLPIGQRLINLAQVHYAERVVNAAGVEELRIYFRAELDQTKPFVTLTGDDALRFRHAAAELSVKPMPQPEAPQSLSGNP